MEQKSFTTDFLGTTYDCHYITKVGAAQTALKHLMKKDCLFAIDTETAALPQFKSLPDAGLSPHLSEIRLIQIFDGTNVCVFDLRWFPKRALQMFVPFLSKKRFVAHYAIFDLQRFMQMGVQDMNLHCTLILAKLMFHAVYVDDSTHDASLGGLTESLLGTSMLKKMQVSDWSEPELTFEQIEYAAVDVIACLHLANKLAKGLDKFNLHKIYKLSKDAQHPLARMQLNGFKLNRQAHTDLIPVWKEDLVAAKATVEEITGIKKLTSPKLGDWLNQNLEPEVLAMWPRTDGGRLSTSADTFADFSYHEVVAPFAEYQKRATLCSTFGQRLINQINPQTGRLHARYKLLGARTGRLSCSEPNLQNLPRDNKIRSNFISEEGYMFLCADYSQIELRIAAEVSRDEQMLAAFKSGKDLHALTASRVLNKPYEFFLTPDGKKGRQIGKALGLGLLYGLGAKKFSHYVKKGYAKDNITVSEAEAFQYIEKYRETYSGFRDWQIRQAENCHIELRAITPFGKIRKLNEQNYYGGGLNVPIQGAAAEVILCSLVRLEKAFRGIGDLVNCVHDENIIEVPICADLEAVEYQKNLMRKCMVDGYLDVFPEGITTKLIDVNTGFNWADAK